MSTVKVNTLTGTTTAGSIAVTGEGNSTTTNLQQGLAKVWVHFTTVTSTAVRDSFNVTGLTDEGTGRTTVTIANDMTNNDYAAVMFTNANNLQTGGGAFGNQYLGGLSDRTSAQLLHESYGSAFVDAALCDVTIHGDLA